MSCANPPGTSSSGGAGGGGSSGCSGGSGSGSGGGGSGPCGACKFLRRKCVPGCVFAPYFDSEQGAAHFAAVHKVFGASNVSKLLSSIPVHKRVDAVVTVCYEAQARVRDPVYGCVAHIMALQQQVLNLQAELQYLQAQVESMAELPTRPVLPPPLTQPPSSHLISSAITITDVPTAIYMPPAPHDLSSLFDPISQQVPWVAMQRAIDPRHSVGLPSALGDLQAVAGELLRGQRNSLGPTSSSPSIPKKE